MRGAIILGTFTPLCGAVLLGVIGFGCAPVETPCVAVDVIADAPRSVALAEGGRGFLTLRADPRVTVRVEGLIAGFTARVREDGVHVVRAPYGITGTLPARLEATCDDGDRATAPLDLVIAPLEVRALAPVNGGASPGPREHPGLAVVPAGVVVVGGVHERGALSDAWLLPRGSDAWIALNVGVSLASVVGAGSIRATARDDGRVLLLGPAGATAILDVSDVNMTDARAALEVLAPGGDVPAESDGAALVRARAPAHGGEVQGEGEGEGEGDGRAHAVTLALCGHGAARHCRAAAFIEDARGALLAPWRLLEPAGFEPAGREGAIVDVDQESRRLVLFGGQLEDGVASDAWTVSLEELTRGGNDEDQAGAITGAISWQQLAHRARGDAEPAPRRGACGAIDPVGHRLLVVGGASATGPARGMIAFDLEIEREASFQVERPQAWREIDVDGMPDGTVGCAAAWDPVAGRLVVGFGAAAEGVMQNLWALDVSPER